MAIVLNGTTGISSPGGDVSVSQSLSGNLVFTGTGNRITGDFTNATVANRVLLQTSTANGATSLTCIPNGTSTFASVALYASSSDPANTSFADFSISGVGNFARIRSFATGTGTVQPIIFDIGNSERMRITSAGNVGIGTTNTLSRLTYEGSFNASSAGSFPSLIGIGAWGGGIGFYDGGNAAGIYTQSSGGQLNFFTGQSGFDTAASKVKMILDSSGNLGLGVTPSAWFSGYKVLQIGDSGSLFSLSTNAGIAVNAIDDGAWKYRATGFAGRSYFSVSNGSHVWVNAPSGTAGNAISFTQAMTLTSAGHLLVGTTTATNNRLVVAGSLGATVGNHGSSIRITNTDSGNYVSIGAGIVGTNNAGMQFSLDGTSCMVIDPNGNLIVGATAAATGSRLRVKTSGATNSTYGIYFENASSSQLLYIEDGGTFSTGNAASSPYNNTTASAANVHVGSTGILFRSTSSLKYKTDVQDATYGLAEVMQLRPVTYKGKSEADGDKVFGGLIAEEVHEAGLTEFVQYAEDGTPDALAYGNMVSLLVKAIQELTARLEVLENK